MNPPSPIPCPSTRTSGVVINVEPQNTSFGHYLWVIDPFEIVDSHHHVSPDFGFGNCNRNIWSLEIKLKSVPVVLRISGVESNFVSFEMQSLVSATVKKYAENLDTKVKIEFCIAGPRISKEPMRHACTLDNCSEGQKFELTPFTCLDMKHNALQESASKVLVVDFTISLIDLVETNVSSNISNDFGRLLESKNLSDVVIVVGKEVINVHKAVLAARSSVFSAMLETDMKEKRTNRIEIPDVTPEVILKLLEYMYTDKVEDLENCAKSLIGLSEMYQLEGLKTMCSIELGKVLTLENAVESLILAELYKANILKSTTLNFIARHRKSIEKISQLDSLDQSYPHLLREILITTSRC